MSLRIRWALGLALLVSSFAFARDLPNYHRVFSSPLKSAPGSGLAALNKRMPHSGSARSSEPRFALPTVLRAPYTGREAAPSARTPVEAARQHLRAYASAYSLSAAEADGAVVKHVHDTGRGAIIVKFVSRPRDLEVWGEQLNVVMDRKFRLVGMTGYLSTPSSAAGLFGGRMSSARASVPGFSVDHAGAVAAAYGDLTGTPLGAGAFRENGVIRGDYRGVQLRPGISTPSPLSFPARARQVLFHMPGTLVPAYYVEVASRDPEARTLDYYGYVISGRDGSVLVRSNLVAHAQPFIYQVWADSSGIHQPFISPVGNGEVPAPAGGPAPADNPYTLPPAVARQDVSLVSGPISTGDPWLKDDATETVGNNVHAYADLGGEDGFSPAPGPDYTAETTGTRAFQYDWAESAGANTSVGQNKAAITQLFFMTNWLHDWYYDNGFDEAAGNAQDDNYDRGPAGGDLDAMFVEAEDFGGTDNANMWTPADGAPPRMQMYVFDGIISLSTTPTVEFPPASVRGVAGGSRNFDLTGTVVHAAPANACTALTNATAVAGKVVLIDRGTCTFAVKAANAVAAGAAGIIFWNATNGAFGTVTAAGPTNNVPNLFIDFTRGNALLTAVGAGAVDAHMISRDLDGALDEGVVAHEWGHYIQHRLIAGGAQDSTQGAGMGEGWSDFHALLFMVRADDKNQAGNDQWQGAYGVGNYVSLTFNSDERWFGIRRVTYSTDPAKNGVTFKYIGANPASVNFPWLGRLASDPPLPVGQGPEEVHNTGEIWATMLWECYASLLNAYSFDEAQTRMKDYVVASYKVTPPFPTFVEARDALLQVVAANSVDDYNRFGQAFAKRGLGVAAVAPDRGDDTNSGLVESFDWLNNFRIETVAVTDGPTNCDGDGILDSGEVGLVAVTVRNVGKETLTAMTGTATSSTTGITFPDSGALTFPDIAPGTTGVATTKIALAGATTPGAVTVNVNVAGQNVVTASQPASVDAPTNSDDVATATTDTFEALNSNWSIEVEPHTQNIPVGTVWNRGTLDDGTAGFFVLNNLQADESLISPPIQVKSSGDFTVSWKHSYGDATPFFPPFGTGQPQLDGVVVEISSDQGATWTDMADATLGAAITAGYDNTLVHVDGRIDQYQNPLNGRMAFTDGNPSGLGNFDPVTVNFHDKFAGKTVQIRFRYGGGFDDFNTIFLYELDDVAVTNVSNTPFLTEVTDAHVCVPIPDAGPDQIVNEQATATLHGAAPDLSGGAVTHTWTQVDGPSVHLSDPSAFEPTFTAPLVNADTPLTFQLSATGTNGTRSATTHVLVKDVGHPPVPVIAGGGREVAPGESVTLDASGSTDPDGGNLTFDWSQASGEPGTFSAATGSKVTFKAPSKEGTLTIALKATDSTGLYASANSALVVKSGSSNSGCSTTGSSASGLGFLVVLAALALRRRRRLS
jgi:MYXO-CTERM domain-containing protein